MVYNLTPNLCLLCRCYSDGGLLCLYCAAAMPTLGPACRHCALPLSGGEVCGRCLRKPPIIAQAVAAQRYESWTKTLIHRFKFERDLRVGHYLAQNLSNAIEHTYQVQTLPQLLLPVPLHPQRLYERGFNQATEIAQVLARQFSIELARDQAIRQHHSVDQIGLSALARRRNVRGVFRIKHSLPAHIAIIDDVVTTGATVLELAKQARQHGAERIDVWCVARTVNKMN